MATRNLVTAAKAAGVRHLVYISVVGADRTPVVSGIDRTMFGYIAAKRDAERIIAESGIPYTILRASQFHDLLLTMAEQMGKLPVVPVPAGMKAQPIDAAEVADRLVELALGAPAGRVPDMAGPRVYELASCSAATSRPPASAARCCRCRCPVGPRRLSARAPTSRRTGRSASGPGRRSSTNV